MPMIDRELYEEEVEDIKQKALYSAKKHEKLIQTIELEMQNDKEERKNKKIENANNRIVLKTANEALKIAKGSFDQINNELIGKLREHIVPEEKVAVGRGNEIEVTPTSRNMVLLASVLGQSQPEIAYALGMSKPSLTKHFRKELDIGAELDSAFIGSVARVAAMKGIADPKHAGALAVYVANKTDIQPKGSIDHTNSDKSMANIWFVPDSPKQGHVDRKTKLDLLKAIPDEEIQDAEFVDVNSSGDQIDGSQNSNDENSDENSGDQNSGEENS